MYGVPAQELIDLQIIDPASVELYYPHVRDREDVRVLRCAKSEVIFLDRTDHIGLSHYEEMVGTSYWEVDTFERALSEAREDDERRAQAVQKMFGESLSTKRMVDVGCGTGGVMLLLKNRVASMSGVEPQEVIRNILEKKGFTMFKTTDELSKNTFDIFTLFHVLEHVLNPLETLMQIKKAMRPEATLFVEVPHARDALLSTFNLDSFKKFTFWSEHLVLHTRESLQKLLEAAGFQTVEVLGLQRYPLANHLHWLWKGEPGGQKKLPQFRDTVLETAYFSLLDSLDITDSLWAIAKK